MCVGGIILALQPGRAAVLAAARGGVRRWRIIVGLIIRRMRPLFRLMQTRIDAINRVLREQITGVRVIRAFVRDPQERDRFAAANDELFDVSLGAGRLMALMFPSVMLVLNLSSIAVLWFGGHLVASGGMQIGALTAFLSYLLQILMSVMMATFVFMMVPRAEVCAERIVEVLDTDPDLLPPDRPVARAGPATGTSSCGTRSSAIPGPRSRCCPASASRARPGEVTAVIGGTGSGKTTLLSLIPRLMDVTGGAVLIDGVDVRELSPALLSDLIGLVPQQPYLFSGTVATNLRYGNQEATDDDLWHALEIAQARDFVEQMPGGLDAPIAQGGTNVSGGQRQRLAIARALVHRPEIYLFDDSFSALDYATDARLRAALAAETAEATVVIVAQRVATIRHADQIIVLDAGRDRRHRHPRRADEHRRDLPGDRALPADRAGGSGVSGPGNGQATDGAGTGQAVQRSGARRRNGAGERATPKRGPGRRRHGPRPGPPVHGRRHVRRRSRSTSAAPAGGCWARWPRTGCWSSPAWCWPRSASPVGARAVAARRRHQPHLRGRHQQADPGRGQQGPDRWPGCAARATARRPTCCRRMHVVPGQGIDFGRVGQVLLLALLVYLGSSAGMLHAGTGDGDGRAAGGLPAAGAGPGQAVPAAAELLRPAAPRRDPQPGHQRHRQPGPVAAADAEPAGHLGADRSWACSRSMFLISPLLALIALVTVPVSVFARGPGSASARSRSSSSSGRPPAS